jgi:tetratricopeptide (TPR) repeat protein
MMVLVASCMLLFVCFLPPPAGAAQTASPPLSSEWKRLRSAHFTIVGNAGEKDLREAATQLEQFRAAMLWLFPRLELDDATTSTLVVFKGDASFTPFKPRDTGGRVVPFLSSYFLASPDLVYMMVQPMRLADHPFLGIFHEFTHAVVERNLGTVPGWVNEGLAEFYSAFEIRDARGVIGGAPLNRGEWLLGRRWLPLDAVVKADTAERSFPNVVEQVTFSAQAWLLVHYTSIGPRKGQLSRYVDALARGASAEEAFRRAFNTTYRAMSDELRAYMRQPRMPAVLVPAVQAAIGSLAIEPMTEADAQQLQGDLLTRTGAYDAADRAIAAALKLDANHGPARKSLGLLRLRQGRTDEGIAALTGATAAMPSDFSAQYWLAAALLEAGRLPEAASAYARAVNFNERSTDAWLGLSVATLALDRAPQAEAALATVMKLAPDAAWYVARARAAYGLGKHAAAVQDVEQFLRLSGAVGDNAVRAACLGMLAHWRLGQAADASVLADKVTSGIVPQSWSAVVMQFMQDKLPARDFLARAADVGQRTEAYTYVGIRASIAGRRDEALTQLRWVKENGSRAYMEFDLAEAELRRLEAPAR